MGLNLGAAASAGAQAFMLTENPLIAGIAALAGGVFGGGGGNIVGGIGNTGLAGLNNADEAFQLYMYGQQMQHQEQMQVQSEAFNEMMDEKSEQMREVNTLRDVQMAQRKADNSITKKFIESITE
ncbi:MAG TPA: hypothetical protein VFH72_06220 [Candidatus Baltobacteraceae bacterium]|nr:hypothetical protein [Candidatus Baltobacteraceae bacterium]